MLFELGAVTELRVLETPRGVASGYFNDPERHAESAAEWNGKGSGVYVTLNVVNPELLARAANRTKEFAKKTTTDTEILGRRWLPIDPDPQRPAGICATDEEHEAAVQRANLVRTSRPTLLGPACRPSRRPGLWLIPASARPQAAKRSARVDRAHVTRFLMKSCGVWR